MKKITYVTFLFAIALFIQKNASAQIPSIVINGDTTLADNSTKFPFWLNQSNTLSIGQHVNGISVIEFTVADQSGVQVLNFNQVRWVTSEEFVPSGKVWKIESVALKTSAYAQGSGDNWGGQSVVTDAALTGNGTSGAPLDLAQQGATTNQVLQWDGNAWVPADASAYTNATLTGNGTPGNPFGIAQQSATNGQVLAWNGTTWIPSTNVAAPADCPSGYTAVNEKYCIQTNENTVKKYFDASNDCRNQGGRLCEWTEWQYACQKGSLSPALTGMTNNAEWIGQPRPAANYGAYGDGDAIATAIGNGGCQGTPQYYGQGSDLSTATKNYRCCFDR